MSMRIVESELPIAKHGIGKCHNCNKTLHVRLVKVFSAYSDVSRGYLPLCFFCAGPVFRWRDDSLKDSRTWETPYSRGEYMAELLATDPEQEGSTP